MDPFTDRAEHMLRCVIGDRTEQQGGQGWGMLAKRKVYVLSLTPSHNQHSRKGHIPRDWASAYPDAAVDFDPVPMAFSYGSKSAICFALNLMSGIS